MKPIIRKAILTDSGEISTLTAQLGYISDSQSIYTRLNALLNHEEHCVYIAVSEGVIVGWIHGFFALRVESSPFIEIGGLVVHEAFRNRGIGKSLIDEVKIWATTIGCDKLRVRCNVKRIESHEFYKNIGFKETKEQKIFDQISKNLKA
ncbi:MAG: GNAT family N-acetyltransferase [Gelidibacter sp.]